MISDETLILFRDQNVMIPLKGVYATHTDSGFRNSVVYGILMSWDASTVHIGDGANVNTVISRRDIVAVLTADSSFFAGTSDQFSIPEGEEYQ